MQIILIYLIKLINLTQAWDYFSLYELELFKESPGKTEVFAKAAHLVWVLHCSLNVFSAIFAQHLLGDSAPHIAPPGKMLISPASNGPRLQWDWCQRWGPVSSLLWVFSSPKF